MRCLIGDDHPLMRQALAATVTGRWPAMIVEQAASFPEVWAAAAKAPEVCLVDLAMPGAEPVEGVARVREIAPETVILVVTGLTDPALLAKVRECGVTAILSKTFEAEELLAPIQAALGLPGGEETPSLTERQRDVLRLMGAGLTNKEIGLRLGIAPATVKIHVSRIITLMGAVNRTDAVFRAEKRGLVDRR
ncbi:response regulator transcription factor [Sphingomonas sp. ID1715]|uniref:response regulator transcription factor n=1 Tax=Sphingomonas sp. ID1715 TaxID=1656898 RepID=UPI001489AA4F|nr:response regulator transcription factor [Sphingomonas sp. ID1715]NNM76235.1 response regulator transcription factor [Sphingomonas sp. ID1715]